MYRNLTASEREVGFWISCPVVTVSFFRYLMCAGVHAGKLCGGLGSARQPDSGPRGAGCGCAYHGGKPAGNATDELHPQQC